RDAAGRRRGPAAGAAGAARGGRRRARGLCRPAERRAGAAAALRRRRRAVAAGSLRPDPERGDGLPRAGRRQRGGRDPRGLRRRRHRTARAARGSRRAGDGARRDAHGPGRHGRPGAAGRRRRQRPLRHPHPRGADSRGLRPCARGQRAMRREVWLPGVALSALAVALRLLVAARREGIEVDGILYLANAAALAGAPGSFNAVHQPLYSLVLAPLLGLTADPEWLGRVVAAVAGGLWVWPTLWLAHETTDERVAWPAGLLVAVLPAAVDAGTRVLPDTLLVLLTTTTLAAAVWAVRTTSPVGAAVTGAAGALASLAHPVGIGFLAL